MLCVVCVLCVCVCVLCVCCACFVCVLCVCVVCVVMCMWLCVCAHVIGGCGYARVLIYRTQEHIRVSLHSTLH